MSRAAELADAALLPCPTTCCDLSRNKTRPAGITVANLPPHSPFQGIVPFASVVTNEGGFIYFSDGSVLVPEKGLYLISYTISAGVGSTYGIRIDGVVIATQIALTSGIVSDSVVVFLKAGAEVAVSEPTPHPIVPGSNPHMTIVLIH